MRQVAVVVEEAFLLINRDADDRRHVPSARDLPQAPGDLVRLLPPRRAARVTIARIVEAMNRGVRDDAVNRHRWQLKKISLVLDEFGGISLRWDGQLGRDE